MLWLLRAVFIVAACAFFTTAMRARPGAEAEPRRMIWVWLVLGLVISIAMLSTDTLYVPNPSV